ncbi:phospho-sugar mutase [soil metagenome]
MSTTPLAFDDPAVQTRIHEWTSPPYDEATRKEVAMLVAEGKKAELEDRFYRTLAFGTGGLRGKLGAGTNRMNSYIVARATQGLANYVKANATAPGPLRAAIAHDSRHRSREFCETAAGVFAANGFYVHVSPALRPTPYLSFAIRNLGCHTGIVVTASHNPKEYNGYKVYWDDGSQVIPPHDEGIIGEVDKITSDDMVQIMGFQEGVAKGMIKIMGEEMDALYIEAIRRQRFDEKVIREYSPKIVYTPLHGVGGTLAPRAFKDWGFTKVSCEPEQMKPDGDFPTAASPNPEEGAALDLAIKLAREENADLVLATDPDADRLGIAVRHDGEIQLMTGNQVSSLLADFIIKQAKATGRVTGKPGIVTTIVTSPMVEKVARNNGAECPLVLTGFKWIAEQIRQWEATPGSPQFLYGTEESYGYLIGDHCRDKDGIVAACCVAEMACHARSEGRTLVDQLHDIFLRIGVHYEWGKSITLPGVEGARQIQAMLESVRKNPPTKVGDRKVVRYVRYDTGEIFENGKAAGRVPIPPSDVYLFDLEDGSRAIVRPSGTEPKIKFYFFMCDPTKKKDLKEVADTYQQMSGKAPQFEKDFFSALGIKG